MLIVFPWDMVKERSFLLILPCSYSRFALYLDFMDEAKVSYT